MSDLKFKEKNVFENLFNNGGSVHGFTNRSFVDFFTDHNVDIYDDKYAYRGDSKMNRLRAFWEKEHNELVGRALEGILGHVLDNKHIKPDNELIQPAREIIARLQGKEVPQKEKVEPEDAKNAFLGQKFPEINYLKLGIDAHLQSAIEQRIDEIGRAMKADAPLSVIFLCGSTLEGLLLDRICKNPQKANKAKSSPKDKDNDGKVKTFGQWTLSELIDVAYEISLIKKDVKSYGQSLRDFRNYIHPREQAREQALHGFTPDKHTAEMSQQVLRAAIADLTGTR